jgi:hypothetical protein
MNQDEHDQSDSVWELLGKARKMKASPAFTQNVMRSVRMSEPEAVQREVGFVEWLRQGWNGLALAGAAAVVAIAALAMNSAAPAPSTLAAKDAAAIEQFIASQDFDVMADLDVLIAMENHDLWLDASLR